MVEDPAVLASPVRLRMRNWRPWDERSLVPMGLCWFLRQCWHLKQHFHPHWGVQKVEPVEMRQLLDLAHLLDEAWIRYSFLISPWMLNNYCGINLSPSPSTDFRTYHHQPQLWWNTYRKPDFQGFCFKLYSTYSSLNSYWAILFFLTLSRLPLSPHPTDDTTYYEVTLKKRLQSPLLYDPT